MKKRMFCFVSAILLVFFMAGPVLAAHPPGGSSSSIQEMFAKLQQELADTAKQDALNKMQEIERIQAEKKLAAGFLNAARECRSAAASTERETEMPSDMVEYMKANGIAYSDAGGDLLLTSREWETAIVSLEGYLDGLGSNIQQEMIYLQDYMGQYNSYLQGANTAISNAEQTLSEIARGQSMYGDSEVGLAVTGLVVGLVLGCLITLAVQKSRGKKDKT